MKPYNNKRNSTQLAANQPVLAPPEGSDPWTPEPFVTPRAPCSSCFWDRQTHRPGQWQTLAPRLPHLTCHEMGGSHLLSLRACWAFSIHFLFPPSAIPQTSRKQSHPCRVLRPGGEGLPTPRRACGGWFRSNGLICKPPRGDGLALGGRPEKCAFFLGRSSVLERELCFPTSHGLCLPPHSRILVAVLLIEPKLY